MPLPVVFPAAGWTGVAGSGFTTVPVDPVRTSAKPALRLLVPANQYFTDELLVGVMAGANNQGSLLENLGLEKVILHFEGTSVDIAAPSFASFADANGNAVSYFGWWVILKRPAGAGGQANVYFEAVPGDPAMQHRVIGPYRFSPQTTLYDAELLVTPSQAVIAGQRYQSINAALTYIRTTGKQNTRITVTEPHPSGAYSLTTSGSYQSNGYHRIEATVPVTIGMTSYTSDAANFLRPGVNGLHFRGSNITIDFAYAYELFQESGAGTRQHWLDGVNVTNSLGRNSYWRLGAARPSGFVFRNGAWFTECAVSNLLNVCNGKPPLVRGCSFTNIAADLTGDAQCFVGNVVNDQDSIYFATDVAAFSLSYAGAEATATLELSGGNEANSRTFTARWGANSATFTVGATYALYAGDTNYKFSHVVNWLNGLGVGFAATLIDDTRRASSACKLGTQGVAFAATDVKSAPLTVYSLFDVHSDFYQQNIGGEIENVVIMDNRGWQLVCQNIFLSPPGASATRDFLVINNALANKAAGLSPYDNTDNYFSQQGRVAQSHIIAVHNSMPNQGWSLRVDTGASFDAYCLIANNAIRTLGWSGTPDGDLVMKDNHIHAGWDAPSYATGTTSGGDQTSLFADYAGGDFTPAGALRTNRKPPVLKYDYLRNARKATAPVGAVA